MHGPCASCFDFCIFFLFCSKGASLFAGRRDVASPGGRGWQTAGLGSGADASGDSGHRRTTTRNGGHIYPLPHARERETWVGLFASAIERCKRGRQKSAGYRSRGNWRWVRAESGSCLVSLVLLNAGDSARHAFFFVCCVIPVSGVGDRKVMPSHREEAGQCQS